MRQGINRSNGLFRASIVRNTIDAGSTSQRYSGQQIYTTGSVGTSSFRYDPAGSPLRSTQQLNIDYTSFANHTFFNSAEVKTNVAFENIVNRYPFDGTRHDIEIFHDSLTGFEQWIFQQLPKNIGYLKFSGGSYIRVDDHAGINFPAISRDSSGVSVLDPGFKPMTFEMHVHVPPIVNDNSVILQKLSGTRHGFTLGLLGTSSITNVDVFVSFVSASTAMTVTGSISKGDLFTHLAAVYDRNDDVDTMYLYADGRLLASSSTTLKAGNIDFNISPLYIGSGSTIITGSAGASFVPSTTFSGALDELRIYHSARSQAELKRYMYQNVFADESLKLYFKFNEPSGVIGRGQNDRLNRVVLDSSGNSLTSFIDESTFSFDLRATGSIVQPLLRENAMLNPVLFMMFEPTLTLNRTLLHSASLYDDVNPNLITKLIPPHYLDEGQLQHAFDNVTGTIGNSVDGVMPGEASLGDPQLLSALLYVIASELDELRLFIEHLANIIHVDYDDVDSTPDQFLNFLAAYKGFDLPGLFNNSSAMQFVNAEDIDDDGGIASISLQRIQNRLWRRVLTNINEIIRSKGTQHSIKAFLRSLGIEPNAGFRIREYGGSQVGTLDRRREVRSSIVRFIEMPNSIQGALADAYIRSSPLVANEHSEPGFPLRAGTNDDVKLTSGSWTYEAIYRFPITTSSVVSTSSLVRMMTEDYGVLLNLQALSGTYVASSSVVLNCKPVSGALGNTLRLAVTGCNIVDGDHWHVAFGRIRNDDPMFEQDHVSSSYFLHVTRLGVDEVLERFVTSSYFMESINNDHSSNRFHTDTNTFLIGSLRWIPVSLPIDFLTGSAANDDSVMAQCRIGRIRFWSKALSPDETYEHARNVTSLGVIDPFVNFNHVLNSTGSWERLRLDVMLEQPVTMSNSLRGIELFDFSQNEHHMTGALFTPSSTVIHPEQLNFSMRSSRFDEATSDDKIRIHGFSESRNVELYGGILGPIHDKFDEHSIDDPRLTIDFSIADALNDDIVGIFATFDALDEALGGFHTMFDAEYADLVRLRDVYFDRLIDRIRLKTFFEYFRWFDMNIGRFIEQLIPYKTKFMGTSYVIESHMLERPKFQHRFETAYIANSDRHARTSKNTTLQLISGRMKRY